MTPEAIESYMNNTYPGLNIAWNRGEKGFFHNPGDLLKLGTYVATLKFKDGPHDRASRLDDDGGFRFNISVPKEHFMERIGELPKDPPKGGVIAGSWNFLARNELLPHPCYGGQGWFCIVNPSAEKFEAECVPLIKLAHGKAVKLFNKRKRKNVSG